MALTLNAVTSFANRAVLAAVSRVWDVGASLPFDNTYNVADTYGNKYMYPGMLVAFNSDKSKYIPWSAAGSYGTYSSYLEGILHNFYDATWQEQIVAPATRCAAIADNCYVYGGTVGDIPMTARTASSIQGVQIQWDE